MDKLDGSEIRPNIVISDRQSEGSVKITYLFHFAFQNSRNYLSILGPKLNNACKKGPW